MEVFDYDAKSNARHTDQNLVLTTPMITCGFCSKYLLLMPTSSGLSEACSVGTLALMCQVAFGPRSIDAHLAMIVLRLCCALDR